MTRLKHLLLYSGLLLLAAACLPSPALSHVYQCDATYEMDVEGWGNPFVLVFRRNELIPRPVGGALMLCHYGTGASQATQQIRIYEEADTCTPWGPIIGPQNVRSGYDCTGREPDRSFRIHLLMGHFYDLDDETGGRSRTRTPQSDVLIGFGPPTQRFVRISTLNGARAAIPRGSVPTYERCEIEGPSGGAIPLESYGRLHGCLLPDNREVFLRNLIDEWKEVCVWTAQGKLVILKVRVRLNWNPIFNELTLVDWFLPDAPIDPSLVDVDPNPFPIPFP